jgi:nucleoside-diphosphate-sugar epimerase
MERIRVLDAVKMVTEYAGYKPQIRFQHDMPTGPINRVADNSLAKRLLGWEPKTPFREGLRKTMDWYFASKQKEDASGALGTMLTAR